MALDEFDYAVIDLANRYGLESEEVYKRIHQLPGPYQHWPRHRVPLDVLLAQVEEVEEQLKGGR
jgi:hypothetical protein